MSEYLREAWDHRGDGYWWADNQLLLTVLVAIAAGSIALGFKYLELAMERKMGPSDA